MTEPTQTVDHDNHPKGPNFLLIVILFGVVIIVGFVVAYFVLTAGGKHLIPGKHDPHPTSHLVLPALEGLQAVTKSTNESRFIFQQQINQTCV